MEQLNKDQLTFLMDCMLTEDDDILSAVLQDSDEEEALILELYYKKEKRRKTGTGNADDFMKTISSYSEEKFRKQFRVTKALFKSLTEKFESGAVYKGLRRDRRCSASKHIAVFLWFAGHERCSFRDVGKRFDLSFPTASLMVERVTKFLSELSATVIKWPNEEQKQQSNVFFENKFGFSKAIGCIGGTHIVIEQPCESKEDYLDQKGNFSVCLQAICNEEKKFIDIFVGLPGSSQESWVYQNSPAYQILKEECGDHYVLGNSVFPSSKNLVTPYRDHGHMTSIQRKFNAKLSASHLAIEHTLDILVQRFPKLRCCKLRDMSKICHFVRACCVLHNITDEDDFDFSLKSTLNPVAEDYADFGEIVRGNAVRDAICREMQLAESLAPEVINESQMEVLVAYMEANLDLALGICPNTQSKRWRKLAITLNSHGPPVHRCETWVKVWTNFKLKIKKKKAENKLKRKSTGARPNKLHKFSQFEERVCWCLLHSSVPKDDKTEVDIKVEGPDLLEGNTKAVSNEPGEDNENQIDIKVEATDLLETNAYPVPTEQEDNDNEVDIKVDATDPLEANTYAVLNEIDIKVDTTNLLGMNEPVDPLVADQVNEIDIKVEPTQLSEVDTHFIELFRGDDTNEIDLKIEMTDLMGISASLDPLIPEDDDNKIVIKVETSDST